MICLIYHSNNKQKENKVMNLKQENQISFNFSYLEEKLIYIINQKGNVCVVDNKLKRYRLCG